MLSLIIDGNYMLNKMVRLLYSSRNLYNPVDPHMVPKGYEWMETELELAMYRRIQKMEKFEAWSHIFTVCDTRNNWRKKRFPEYKANRLKDDVIDWGFVYSAYDRWKDGMLSSGHNVYWMDGLEGDDWISFVTEELNRLGSSVVIATGDGDMKQLCRTSWHEHNKWMNILWKEFISRYKFVLPHDYVEWQAELDETDDDGELDLFDMKAPANSMVTIISNITSNYEFETTYWKEFLFKKLLEGDKSDNVASAITKTQNRKNGGVRNVGIGPGTSQKIWADYTALYGEDLDFSRDDWMDDVKPIVMEKMRFKEHEVAAKERKFAHAIKRNQQIMQLSTEFLPSHFKEALQKMKLIKNDTREFQEEDNASTSAFDF